MPWVAPKTDFVNGDVLTATQMNNIGGDLAMLNGGTTGQVLSKASNANGDFAWTSETDPSAIPKTLIDAKGDLIAGSAADTAARLAVGTNGQVLTADSTTATGLKWATSSSGGMTLLASGTLSGSSVSITSISGSYINLVLQIVSYKPANDGSGFYLQFNSDTGTNYFASSTLTGSSRTPNAASLQILGGQDNATDQSLIDFYIPRYASTTSWKVTRSFAIANNSTTNTNADTETLVGWWKSTNAITTIGLFPGSGNFTSGNYYLYGVN